MRSAINNGDFLDFKSDFLGRYQSKNEI
jgi:queuine/archaeosine tRNA-ribosyltransferase